MNEVSTWFDSMRETTTEMQSAIIAYAPSLIGALLLLALGWLAARLARRGAVKLGGGANRLLERVLRVGRLGQMRLSSRVPELIGSVVFWLVIVFFVTAATKVAGLEAFSSWLHEIVTYLPKLAAGGLIVLVGYLLSAMVRDLVVGSFASAGLGRSDVVGALSQGAIILVAVVIGIDQIGIDVTFLITIVAIVVTAILGGISLAFALGARTFVSNLIGAHYLQQQIQPGQRARIGEVEGEVLDLTATSVVLATPEGRMMVPAKLFNEVATTLIVPGQDDE